MKNRVLAVVLAIVMVVCLLPSAVFADETGVELSEANFPDKTLREELKYYDTDEDGILSEYEQYGPTILNLSGKSITTLKGVELLPHLMQLFVDNCGLKSIDALPENLMILSCKNNELTALPELPDSLITLDCSGNRISELPKLSASLEGLNCSSNELTALPELPDSLTTLKCVNNRLQHLPKLPAGLECRSGRTLCYILFGCPEYGTIAIAALRHICERIVNRLLIAEIEKRRFPHSRAF